MSRKPEHTEWLTILESLGYLPCDWVRILERNLTEEEAKEEEQALIMDIKPRFNINHTGEHRSIDKDLLKQAQELKEQGIVGSQAAKLLEVSVMTTWRYQYEY